MNTNITLQELINVLKSYDKRAGGNTLAGITIYHDGTCIFLRDGIHEDWVIEPGFRTVEECLNYISRE